MDDVQAIDEAIGQLEAQRALLGDEPVDTAVRSLREKRVALLARQGSDQRRLVTVLFADLVDFTVLSQSLDSEDVRTIVGSYFAAWNERVEDNGGVVEKFIGDAVMAVFGLHRGAEDDPRRAVRSALEMTRALDRLNADLSSAVGARLAMRVGIDTGVVVVSTLAERPGHEFVVVGETVNRASRLQGAAPAGGILISADTQRHVAGWFQLEPRPGLELKGIPAPVDAYLVGGERQVGFWLEETRGVEGLQTETVGRDLEIRSLQERFWDVAEERRLRTITVVGDAGMGKSRLLFELERWLATLPDPVHRLRGRATSATVHSPQALVRDLMAKELDDAAGAGRPGLQELARWLGLAEATGPAAGSGHDPEGLRARAKAAFVEHLAALAAEAPVVILLEDLHWADEGSLAFLDEAMTALLDRPVLIVAATRPALFERHRHWGEGLEFHGRLELAPLSHRNGRRLLAEILRLADDVPEPVAELLVEAAEGNPYYLEELVKFLLETAVITVDGDTWRVHEDRVAEVRVPPTLKGVLQARVDGLTASERLVLQRASVIGRVFWDDAVASLRARGESSPAELAADEVLDGLRQREVVYERQRSSFATTREFLFKHAMLRDVTYEGVLRPRRQEYHALAARWLEGLTERTGRHDEYAGVIAAHYEHAGDMAGAARWYLRAGRHAAGMFALGEALRFVGRGLDLVPMGELATRVDLLLEREAVLHRKGEPDAQDADLAEADQVLAGLDDPERRARLLLARCRLMFFRSDYDAQTVVAEEAVGEAVAAGRPDLEAQARLWWGKALTWRNDHEAARTMLTVALDMARCGPEPRLVGETLRTLATVAINQSDFRRAGVLIGDALQVHQDDGDAEGETAAIVQLGSVLYNQGRYEEAWTCIEESLPVFVASGYRYRQAIALGNLGGVALAMGRLGPARQRATEALEVCRQLGEKDGSVINLSTLADVHRRSGDQAGAVATVDEALELAAQLNWAYLLGELHLLLAVLASEHGRHDDALREVAVAVEEAGRAATPLLAGRSSFALGRVLLGAGRAEEAAGPLRAAAAAAEELSVAILVTEARAALASALHRVGQVDEAVVLAGQVLDGLDPIAILGGINPGDVYLACSEVLDAAGDPRAEAVRRAAGTFLDEAAARIGDDDLLEGFRGAPVNAALAARLSTVSAPPDPG